MNRPLVNIIIPAYNSERYISESIESVISQGYKSMEVFVIDDGSTDRTKDAVQQYSEVNYIYQKNGGPSKARNTGIMKAGGKYIAFLDSDDLWPDGKLEKQVNLMEEHTDIALLFGDVQLFTKDGVLVSSMFSKHGLNLQFFGDPFYVRNVYKKLFMLNYIPTGSVIFRRECLEKAGLFDESLRLTEDLDLWLRIAMHYPVGYSTDIWELKRDHGENVSLNIEGMTLALIKIFEKHEREFQDYLIKHQVNLTPRIGEVCSDLGYYYLTNSLLAEARKMFKKSLQRGVQLRTLLYWVSTFLGVSAVGTIRHLRS